MMKSLIILLSILMYVNTWAQKEEKAIFTKQTIEARAKQDLKLITKKFAISDIQKEKLFSFFMYKNKLNRSPLTTEQRKSIVKSRSIKYVQSILNQNNNGKSIVLGEDLLRQLNLYEIEIPKQ